MAAKNLRGRKVTRNEVPCEEPKAFADVWADMLREFPPMEERALLSVESARRKLFAVMAKEDHTDEARFGEAIFHALRECFGSYALKDTDSDAISATAKHDKYIVLDVEGSDDFAIGLARNVDCTHGLIPPNANATCSGLTRGCLIDLGCCLLKKVGNTWRATDIFSIVELKACKTSSCDEDFGGAIMLELSQMESEHGAVGQALAYTLGAVLLYHARNGVLRDIEETNIPEETTATTTTLPLAVIAGRIAGDGRSDQLCWVSGNLHFPAKCGDAVSYGVKSSGRVYDAANEEEANSIDYALSLLLDTILFGIRVTRRVFRDRVGKPFQSDSMTGRTLMIGKQRLNLPLVASPIPNPEHAPAASPFLVSQAELFSGNLNVRETLSNAKLHPLSYLAFGDAKESKELPVIIKVSSTAVHSFLVGSGCAFSAIYYVKDVLASLRGSERQSVEGEIVAGPLLAVVGRGTGLITIMADLTKQKYETLRPKEKFSSQLSTLWEGFKELVVNVLLPFANCNVIHADIRPGFDYTANILVKHIKGGRVRMQLVDFESLVSIQNWMVPEDRIGYIQKEDDWIAMTFLWWQCLFVAYAWLEQLDIYKKEGANVKTDANVKGQRTPMADIKSLREGFKSLAWLPACLHDFASKTEVEEEDVRRTLEELDAAFRERDNAFSSK